MDATQRSAVHNYQRPDVDLGYDPTRTTLWGDAEELQVAKVAGMWRFETSYQRRSPGFEVNDLGYLRRGDQQSWSTWSQLRFLTPTTVYRQIFWNANWWQHWTTDGLPQERAFNTNAHAQLQNRWWLHGGGTVGQLGARCDRCAAGPAVRNSSFAACGADSRGQPERADAVVATSRDEGRSHGGISPEVNAGMWFNMLISASRATGRAHYCTDDGRRTTTFLIRVTTARVAWISRSPRLPPVYAQRYLEGTYADVQELDDPCARTTTLPAIRRRGGGANGPSASGVSLNVVLRWCQAAPRSAHVGHRRSASPDRRSHHGRTNDLFGLQSATPSIKG
jgi:hypothetical protein